MFQDSPPPSPDPGGRRGSDHLESGMHPVALNEQVIRFWNAITDTPKQSLSVGSQVCNLLWSTNSNEVARMLIHNIANLTKQEEVSHGSCTDSHVHHMHSVREANCEALKWGTSAYLIILAIL